MESQKDVSYHNTLIFLLLLIYFFLALINFLVRNDVIDASANESETYQRWVNYDNLD